MKPLIGRRQFDAAEQWRLPYYWSDGLLEIPFDVAERSHAKTANRNENVIGGSKQLQLAERMRAAAIQKQCSHQPVGSFIARPAF